MNGRMIRSRALLVAAFVVATVMLGAGTAQSLPSRTYPCGTSPGGLQLAAHLEENPDLGMF
jgi:hypothetical protein